MVKKIAMNTFLGAIILVLVLMVANGVKASRLGNLIMITTTNDIYYADTNLVAAVQIVDSNNNPLKAELDVKLLAADDKLVKARGSFQTDEQGNSEIDLPLDYLDGGNYLLQITAATNTEKGMFERRVQISNAESPDITVNFDKGMYKPGDEVLFRILATNKNTARPVQQDYHIYIYDGNDNKVYSESVTTSEYGIISGRFALADEVNSGIYRLVLANGTSEVEETFEVQPYFLPKFEVSIETDKNEYVAGDTMQVTVSALYFFGEPVNQGTVSIYIDGLQESVNAPLDSNGEFTLSYAVEEAGVYDISAEVIDNSNYMVTESKTVRAAGDVFEIELMPEHRELIRGIPNDIFIFTRKADGSPVKAYVQLTSANFSRQIATDDNGIGKFTTDEFTGGTYIIDVYAVDMDGNSVSERFSFETATKDVVIRTDKSKYMMGEPIRLNILSRLGAGAITVYAYKSDRLLQVLSTKDDEITFHLGDTYGIIDIYAISDDQARYGFGGESLHSRKTVFINPGKSMQISLSNDKQEYKPGEYVSLNIGVTDDAGKQSDSALLVSIVDEAVLALAANDLSIDNIKLALSDIKFSDELDAATLYTSIISNASEQTLMGLLLRQEGTSPSYGVEQRRNMQEKQEAQSMTGKLSFLFIVMLTVYLLIRFVGAKKIIKTISGAGAIVIVGFILLILLIVFFAACGGGAPAAPAAPAEAAPAPAAEAAPAPAPAAPEPASDAPAESAPNAVAGGDAAVARVRSLFLETMLFIPELIARNGDATIDFMLADNITTWNIQVVGNSKDGAVGYTNGKIKAFQPFFVDFELPRNSVRYDQVSIPVTVFNYTDADQAVTLTIQEKDWFTLNTGPVQTVHVPSNRSQLTYIPITIQKFGNFAFRADAVADGFADAAEKQIKVNPEGHKMERVVSGGTIESDLWQHILFMHEDIPSTRKVSVKLYPSAMSQLIEGLENIFRMPTGCFEQISSSLYPNILALRYMEDNNVIDRQLSQTALGYIMSGYQKLLTYEVRSEKGGFSLYGHSPAETVLTAYGLMQIKDLSGVYNVDEALLDRMREYLFGRQNSNGSFDMQGGSRGGASSRDTLALNAYIIWALSESYPDDHRLSDSVHYLKSSLNNVDDNYTLALIANVLINVNDDMAKHALDKLVSNAIVAPEGAYITSSVRDYYGTHGSAQDLQTTSLVSMALSRQNVHTDTNKMLIDYIISQKDPYGTWHSTQATILCLKALIQYSGAGEPGDGQIAITIGDTTKTIDVKKDNILGSYQVSFDNLEKENIIDIKFPLQGKMVYDIVQEYHVPYDSINIEQSFEIIASMKTELSVNEAVTQSITIITRAEQDVANAMAVIFIPQGFRVDQSSLESLARSGVIEKYETKYESINLYLRDLQPGEITELEIQYRPGYPANITAGQARVYDYYNPATEAILEPVNVVVQ